MTADLGSTADGLLACLCDALEAAGRPVCACGGTVGIPVVGPGQCCACDEVDPGGQLSVSVQRMYPVTGRDMEEQFRIESCKGGTVAADLMFTLARCHPAIDETGNAPTLDDLAPFVDGMYADMQTMWNAIVCCTDYVVGIRETGVESDPQGGCSAVGITVSALVKPVTPVVES